MFKTIAGRLTAGFSTNIIILAIAVAVAFFGASALNEKIERMSTKDWVKANAANQVSILANDITIQLQAMLLNPDAYAEKKQKIQARRQEIKQHIDVLDKLVVLPKGRELFNAIGEARLAFIQTTSQVMDLLAAGQREEALTLFSQTGTQQLNVYQSRLDEFVRFQDKVFEEGAESAQATYRSVVTLLGGVLLAAIALSVAIAGSIVRSVVKPLGGEPDIAKTAVVAIARGDLSQVLPVKPNDRESLLAELEQMRRQLGSMIGGFQKTATELNESAESLAQVSQQVAASSASQSDSSESMAAAIEELTTSISHVSASAGDARRLSAESGEQARSGRAIMEDTAVKMEGIAEEVSLAVGSIEAMGRNSQQITSVVQVIKEVADQTNLLALNAAIEAARAGEQGRGFAVVADEVRKLAERTSTATTEIAAMIASVQSDSQAATDSMSRIVDKVREGVDSAQKASGTMSEIANSAETVVKAVNEISYALEEQSAASQQLAQNVEDVAHMSEQNSQATRAAANTALDLGAAADSLRDTVRVFKT